MRRFLLFVQVCVPVIVLLGPRVDSTKASEPVASGDDRKVAASKQIGPDVDALMIIRRPTQWTPEEVDRYVAEIIAVSERTDQLTLNNPQVQMLAEVGPDNIEFLFEALGKTRRGGDHHLELAIQQLITDDHRELLRRYLPFHPRLASIVAAHGWQELYREELIAGLNRDGYLSQGWFQAVARLDDARVSPGLLRYMEVGNQMIGAYTALKSRGEPGLDEAVLRAWHGIPANNTHRRDGFAPIAARHGAVDALVQVAHSVETPRNSFDKSNELAIRELLPYEGTPNELARMVLENRDRIVFDAKKHQYKIH